MASRRTGARWWVLWSGLPLLAGSCLGGDGSAWTSGRPDPDQGSLFQDSGNPPEPEGISAGEGAGDGEGEGGLPEGEGNADAGLGEPEGQDSLDVGSADLGPARDLNPSAADTEPDSGERPPTDSGTAPEPDLGPPEPVCPPGVTCVTHFPFTDEQDTRQSADRTFDRYGCAPGTDESGPELLYRVTLPTAGFLAAAVEEEDGVDVDVHLLSERSAETCLARGNFQAAADLGPGEAWVVIDTYVTGGVEQAGRFRVRIGFTEPSRGPCRLEVGTMPRVNDGGNHLAMPATGPMVLEAHLVTQEEDYRPDGPRVHLDEHYRLSEGRTSFIMHRRENWAPLEGGDFHGCGIGSPTLFPVLHEHWYVNMYWTSQARPARGARMILRRPGTSRAVVVAAGYETGPGDLSRIGGTTEETHFYLGTGHNDRLTLGIATDQDLPFGPRTCTD